jgi:hypothetical protein
MPGILTGLCTAHKDARDPRLSFYLPPRCLGGGAAGYCVWGVDLREGGCNATTYKDRHVLQANAMCETASPLLLYCIERTHVQIGKLADEPKMLNCP